VQQMPYGHVRVHRSEVEYTSRVWS
jgi:hypothetical protein